MSRYRRRRENFGTDVCPANQLDGTCSGSEPVKGSCSDYYEWYNTSWGGYQWQKCKETDGDTACESYDPDGPDGQSGVCQYACDAGTWNTDGWPCPDCDVDPGYYCPVASTTDAGVECPIGTYSSSTGAVAECTDCGAGTYSAEGASSCTNCAAGTYGISTGASSCTDCAAGTYSSSTGATSEDTCTGCPAGTYSSSTGGTSVDTCTTCGTGTYSAEGATSCSDIANIDCEFRGNSWHIINNSDNTLCGPYSYKTEEACKNAWTTQLINPLTDQVCKTPMKNDDDTTILPGAYVSTLALAHCKPTGFPASCFPPKEDTIGWERTRFAPEDTSGGDGYITEGDVSLDCGDDGAVCFDTQWPNVLPTQYIGGLGNSLPIFHDNDGNLKYSGKFKDSTDLGNEVDWDLTDLADGSMNAMLLTQDSNDLGHGGPWSVGDTIYTNESDYNDAVITLTQGNPPSNNSEDNDLSWPWKNSGLDGDHGSNPYPYWDNDYCTEIGCHGWYGTPVQQPDDDDYYVSSSAVGYNPYGIWGNTSLAWNGTEGYIGGHKACVSNTSCIGSTS
jgi:hypothetical protein